MPRAESRAVDAECFGHAWTQVVDEDVRRLQQLVELRHTIGALQIYRYGGFIAIDI